MSRWIEVGRPQVHGYDLTSIVSIGGSCVNNAPDDKRSPCHRFISGAEEKVLRVFDAPMSTLRLLGAIKQSRTVKDDNKDADPEGDSTTVSWRVERAYLPSLGLSNKATVDTTDDHENNKFAGPTNDDGELAQDALVSSGSCKPPTLKLPSERDLGVTSLWPESQKLFGHDSEIVCLDAFRGYPSGDNACDDKSTLVASSCKARNDVASAAIRLWDTNKGTCVGILKGGHRSTVSTMSFSRDGKYLASSGKDRRICIWERGTSDAPYVDGTAGYELSAAVDSAHKRIVWSVHFCPKASHVLASGSRDGFIKLWRVLEGDDGSLSINEVLRFEPSSKTKKNPVTAVAFAEEMIKIRGKEENNTNEYAILSIGTQSGLIEVWAVPVPSSSITNSSTNDYECKKPLLLCAIPSNHCHFDTVKKVSWRPIDEGVNNDAGLMNLTLATCGNDTGVRIFNLTIQKHLD